MSDRWQHDARMVDVGSHSGAWLPTELKFQRYNDGASAAVEEVQQRAAQAPAPCALVVPRALVAHELEAPVAHAQPVLQDARGLAVLRGNANARERWREAYTRGGRT